MTMTMMMVMVMVMVNDDDDGDDDGGELVILVVGHLQYYVRYLDES